MEKEVRYSEQPNVSESGRSANIIGCMKIEFDGNHSRSAVTGSFQCEFRFIENRKEYVLKEGVIPNSNNQINQPKSII